MEKFSPKLANRIYDILMGNELEEWLQGGGDIVPDIKKNIEQLFVVDDMTANKIFNVLIGDEFKEWYASEFVDYDFICWSNNTFNDEGEATPVDKNKILKQIENLFNINNRMENK